MNIVDGKEGIFSILCKQDPVQMTICLHPRELHTTDTPLWLSSDALFPLQESAE